jgi:hypothetical protein
MNALLSKINWFGLAGGITTIIVVVVSLFSPWWQLTVGDNFVQANASPVNTNFSFLGTAFTIPLIWALNIVSLLSLILSGAVMLVYSVMPAKSYSKHLLGFAYRKPLYTLIFFVVGLFAVTSILQAIVGIGVPLMGSTTVTLPQFFSSSVTISVLLSAGFQYPFWLAIVAAGLCIAARLYHKKVAAPKQPTEPVAVAPPASPAPETPAPITAPAVAA